MPAAMAEMPPPLSRRSMISPSLSGRAFTKVRIRFDRVVAPYVLRRRWHSTQKIVDRVDGTIELTMTVAGTEEVTNWLLG